jgi:hypothetical protein
MRLRAAERAFLEGRALCIPAHAGVAAGHKCQRRRAFPTNHASSVACTQDHKALRHIRKDLQWPAVVTIRLSNAKW